MTQQPLFDLPPIAHKPDAQARLQALVDVWFPDNAPLEELIIIRRYDGWYLCGHARWFGDDGCDWIGATEAEATEWISGMMKR